MMRVQLVMFEVLLEPALLAKTKPSSTNRPGRVNTAASERNQLYAISTPPIKNTAVFMLLARVALSATASET